MAASGAILAAAVSAYTVCANDLEVDCWTIDGGGVLWSTGGDLELSGTIGQPDAGAMTGGDFELSGGFWAGVSPGTNVLPGDMNCDGVVDFYDINPFILRLTDPPGYLAKFPDCPDGNGDLNGNGSVGFEDINPFVALLTGK
jgi:hypothetical protein